ncbi:MAG TPA: HAD-IIIA family hydrolase [Fulvivirga sp.]|nr:HAD-IIIA family hydrolase [Fulvivirga sp.]
MDILNGIAPNIIEKAKNIKAIIFDVDGVLTDGAITYTNSGDEIKSFNVKDGQIISHLKKAGIVVGAVTGRSSELVKRRCEELKLDFCEQGVSDKFQLISLLVVKFNLTLNEVAYIGDDIIDLRVIKHVGLSAAPNDALSYVKDEADLITKLDGGRGVLREVADIVLAAQGILGSIIEDSK